MARKTASKSAARVPLSRERVLRAALAMVDEHGSEALSMRKLAQELGVEAMSLYNHVANKDEILGGMLDLVAGEIEAPVPGDDWRETLRRTAISAHEAFARHPWAGQIWNSTPRITPEGMQRANAMLQVLREAGFSDTLTYHAYHVLQGYPLGYTMQESSFPYSRDQLKRLASSFLRDVPEDEYPYLIEHVRQHMEPGEHRHGDFEFGLDLILDGLERLRDMS